MEENITIYISEPNKGEEQIIINKQYKFNFSHSRKDNSRKEILKYNSSHNHPENEYDVSLSIMKHKIKDGIEKSSIPFGIKIKPLYNKISKEMGLICPEYNSIKSQISRNLNKNYHPIESEYYKTKRGENFMIFKNSNLIIFQSPFQAKLFKKYNNDIFCGCQQVFITRTYVKKLNSFYTTSYAILRNKKKLKKNELCRNENYYNNIEHIINNASESLNNSLNKLFPMKPNFYELINKLKEQEHLSYYDYQMKIKRK
ncbi:hypothetical protein U3516DRAFT_748571 [Neocallimastix sp. 'constans']